MSFRAANAALQLGFSVANAPSSAKARSDSIAALAARGSTGFSTEALERIFRALGLDPSPDFLDKVQAVLDEWPGLVQAVLDGRDWQEETTVETEARAEKVDETLDHIKARTFGILFLQIIKTVKFIVGLLPAGRVILIVLAVVTLLVNYVEVGKVDTDAVKKVIAETGVGQLVEDLFKQFEAQIDQVRQLIQGAMADAESLMNGLTNDADELTRRLDRIYSEVFAITERNFKQHRDAAIAELRVVNSELQGIANSAANMRLVFKDYERIMLQPMEELPKIARRFL